LIDCKIVLFITLMIFLF